MKSINFKQCPLSKTFLFPTIWQNQHGTGYLRAVLTPIDGAIPTGSKGSYNAEPAAEPQGLNRLSIMVGMSSFAGEMIFVELWCADGVGSRVFVDWGQGA